MFAEWNRIMNHLMFIGSYPLELGAMTPIFYAFREREMVQDLIESATGARMHHSYCRVGGLKDDLPRGFLEAGRGGPRAVRGLIREYEQLIMGNEIIFARCRDVGVASRRDRDRVRVLGSRDAGEPASRWTRARTTPTRSTREVEFEVPVGTRGDSLRPALGAGRAGAAVVQHHRAVPRQAPARPVSGRAACRRS